MKKVYIVVEKDMYENNSVYIKKIFEDRKLAEIYSMEDNDYEVQEWRIEEEEYKNDLKGHDYYQILNISVHQKYNKIKNKMIQPTIKTNISQHHSMYRRVKSDISFEVKNFGKDHVLYKLKMAVPLTTKEMDEECIQWELRLKRWMKFSIEQSEGKTVEAINQLLKEMVSEVS